jgi:hypothetical protein
MPQSLAGTEQAASINRSSVSNPAIGLEALPSFQDQLRDMEATFDRLRKQLRDILENCDEGL